MEPVTKDLMYDYLRLHKTLRKELVADQAALVGVRSPSLGNPDEASGGYSPPKVTKLNDKIFKKDQKKNKIHEIESFVYKYLFGDKYSIISLFYFFDWSLKEVANELNLSYQTVKNYQKEAVEDLTNIANRNCIEISVLYSTE